MDAKTQKDTFIKNLIAGQNPETEGSNPPSESCRAMVTYLEQLEETFDASAAAEEQAHIAERVNSILENNHVCLSEDPATALRQMLPIYRSMLEELECAWRARKKEAVFYVFDALVDYTIVYSEKLECFGEFAPAAAFPFPVIETAQEIQLLTKENYAEEMRKILEALSNLTDYLQTGLDALDKHRIVTANEILCRLISQANYILKNFL